MRIEAFDIENLDEKKGKKERTEINLQFYYFHFFPHFVSRRRRILIRHEREDETQC